MATIYGTNRNDNLYDTPGNDTVYTGLGNDFVSCGAGNDSIFLTGNGSTFAQGGTGNDFFFVGPASGVYGTAPYQSNASHGNVLQGDGGADTFAFNMLFGETTIVDFNAMAGDRAIIVDPNMRFYGYQVTYDSVHDVTTFSNHFGAVHFQNCNPQEVYAGLSLGY